MIGGNVEKKFGKANVALIPFLCGKGKKRQEGQILRKSYSLYKNFHVGRMEQFELM